MSTTTQEVQQRLADDGVKFLRLQFTDILGQNKNVEVPESQFEKALNGEVLFDGSSIEGFVRIEESDMLLTPDLRTYRVFPWTSEYGRVGRLICDITQPDGKTFPGCPRGALKRMAARAESLGYVMNAGPEAEFFLFERNPDGSPSTRTHDAASYFDLTPADKGEDCRRVIVATLVDMGFEVEAAHHEVAPGQHEIDFKYADALTTADRLTTFKMVVRKIALDFGLHATFMPKPIFGQNGSGMHTHQSLFTSEGNAFFDASADRQLSETALHYIGGLLAHARGFCLVTNPLVNSYKRLVPGYEAPTNIAWSERNRSPLARIPASRGIGTRVELRMPDPACNPYLAFAAMLASGLDGIANRLDPGRPVDRNVFAMTSDEKAEAGIRPLPANLGEAIDEFETDAVVTSALGSHIAQHLARAKRAVWSEYVAQVSEWEIERYLSSY